MTQNNSEAKNYQPPLQGQEPQKYQYYVVNNKADSINLIELSKILLGYKKIIAFSITLVASISLFIAVTTEPVFRAEALLAPTNKNSQKSGVSGLASQFGGLASIVGVNLNGGGRNDKETILATLRARSFTTQFINENKLLPILFENDFKKNASGEENDSFKPPTMWDAYKLFNDIRKVSEDKNTGLITLSIEWKDPNLAAQWVNLLVARINMHLRAEALKESEQNLIFLRKQIDKTSVVDIQQAMFGLIESEMKKAMLASASDEYAFKVIDKAIAPEERISPNRRKIVMLGVFGGVLLGVVLAFFAYFIKSQREQPV